MTLKFTLHLELTREEKHHVQIVVVNSFCCVNMKKGCSWVQAERLQILPKTLFVLRPIIEKYAWLFINLRKFVRTLVAHVIESIFFSYKTKIYKLVLYEKILVQ